MLKNEIIRLLEEIIARANTIDARDDDNIALDVDLVQEDMRTLYRYYELLKKETAGIQSPFKSAEPVPSFFHDPEPAPEMKADTTPEPATTTATEPTQVPEPEPEPEQAPDEIPHVRSELRSTQTEPEPDPNEIPHVPSELRFAQPEPQPDSDEIPHVRSGLRSAQPQSQPRPEPQNNNTNNGKSFVDLFSQDKQKAIGDQLNQQDNSLHQRLASQKEDKSIGARLQQKPIATIKEAIGLNEKFLFINELFHGDIDAYNDALGNLNTRSSLNEAFDYLNMLTTKYAWDENRSAQTIEKLAGFVQRRYMDK